MASDELRHAQGLLNKVGGILETDGLSGRNTRRAISEARALAGLAAGEGIDAALIAWLEAQPDPSAELPTEGVTFIAREEVGGRDHYERHTAMPHWPGGRSGITIGVGYDLRYSTDIFENDWSDMLTDDVLAALEPHLGIKGSEAAAQTLSHIRIPWTTAWQAFIGRSLPLQIDRTRRPYTTFAQLPPLCRSVLVSLVFNRGPSLTDRPGSDRRREMRAIRDLLADDGIAKVTAQILSMRRLWSETSGLVKRREREATLWEAGLAQA